MKVGVIGASGYTGLELLRVLLRHPRAELVAVTSEQRAGLPVGEAFPALAGLVELDFEPNDPAALAGRADVAFTCLPHAASAPTVLALRKAGVPVVDLSADFRLRDPETYAAAYGPHGAPEIFGQAVYGLPELHREELAGADFVAAPGCYPTSVLLPLTPFLTRELVDAGSVLVDSKSGASGAGRTLEAGYLFAELDENCAPYKVGGVHRHVPEMEEQAALAAGSPVRITFVPHLLPTIRGIVSAIYLRPTRTLRTSEALDVLQQAYAGEPFVRVLPEGSFPSLAAVRGSNFCDVAAVADLRTGTLVLLSALDNLVKGASGQAVQAWNASRGWPETEGLREAPLVP
jgi:N-acetyl-gamma-glutamyl-phosphate reductase